jgi:succinoglycan biosynthesis protein ExoM
MLRDCLDSLNAQHVPNGVALELVVVDNEPEAGARTGVESFAKSCRFPVHYVHQPKRGIATARNSILGKAVGLGADWIAMLDDDETAAPDWVADLMAPEYREIPILAGRRIFVYPSPKPFWAREKEPRLPAEGSPIVTISTSNVRFSAKLVTQSGVRFDESIGLDGGSDHRFFKAALAAGYAARRTNKAITYETVHPERMTYAHMMRAHYGLANTRTNWRLKEDGLPAVLIPFAGHVGGCVLGGLELAISPFAYLISRYRFKQFALRGGKRFAHTAGMLTALLGHRREAYREVVGH